MHSDAAAPPTWRPTAASLRNLTAFWLVLGGVASTLTAARGEASTVAVTAGAVVVAAAIVTALSSRKRLLSALAEPARPQLSNWPASEAARRRQARAGWYSALRTAAVAALIGAVAGAAPVLGLGFAGAGVGGAVGAASMWRTVRRYEREHAVIVLTAARPPGRREERTPLVLGVAAVGAS